MEIFDLMDLAAQGYENRQVNVFYQNDLFKTRVIVLDVSDAFGRPEATGFACHQVAGYNCQWQQI